MALMSTKPAPEAISLQQAAALLDVSERTLRRWGKSGRIELVRVGPKLLRVPRDVLARLRRQRAQGLDRPNAERPQTALERDVADLVARMQDEDDDPTHESSHGFLVIPGHT